MTASKMLKKVAAWSRQPTTVAGASALAATVAGTLSHAMTMQSAIPLLVGGVVAIVLPDNAGARITIERVAADLVQAEQAIVSPKPGASLTVVGSPTP